MKHSYILPVKFLLIVSSMQGIIASKILCKTAVRFANVCRTQSKTHIKNACRVSTQEYNSLISHRLDSRRDIQTIQLSRNILTATLTLIFQSHFDCY